jgi:putative transcriptional regulator
MRRNKMPELITKLKEYRAKTGMKQGELAELVGVRRETIIRLEKGQYNPSLKLAMDIAKVFGVTVEELFSFSEDKA